MKLIKLHTKTIEELKIELMNLLREQFNLVLQHASKKLQKPHLLRYIRRNIAQINTIITEKEKKCER